MGFRSNRYGIRKLETYEEGGRFYDWDTGREVSGPVEPELVMVSSERGSAPMWTWLERGERAWGALRPPKEYELEVAKGMKSFGRRKRRSY